MNTNDETRLIKANQNVNSVSQPAKSAQRKPNDHMGAKVAGAVGAGLVGSAAIGAAAAVVGDYIHDKQEEVADTPAENVATHTEAGHEQAVQQPAPQPPHPTPVPHPTPEPEPEVHFVGINFVDLDEDGTPEIAGALTIDGEDVVVIDLDIDGLFDVAILDADKNGVLDENDIIDISDAQIGVADFAAQVVQENPEGAEEFLATLNAFDAVDSQEDVVTVAQVTEDETGDDGLIEVADEVPEGTFVAVVDSNEPVDDGFVEVAQVEDGGEMIYATNDVEETEMDIEPVQETDLFADNDFDSGVDDMGGSDLIDC